MNLIFLTEDPSDEVFKNIILDNPLPSNVAPELEVKKIFLLTTILSYFFSALYVPLNTNVSPEFASRIADLISANVFPGTSIVLPKSSLF